MGDKWRSGLLIPEAAGAVLANPCGANARPGASGLPLPGTEVRIGQEGAPAVELPPGRAGELLVTVIGAADDGFRGTSDVASHPVQERPRP